MGTDAQRKAVSRYLSKFERINLTLTADHKERIATAAAAAGVSMTSYILEAVDNQITKDNQSEREPETITAATVRTNTNQSGRTIGEQDSHTGRT